MARIQLQHGCSGAELGALRGHRLRGDDEGRGADVARGAATLRLLQRNIEFGGRIFLKGDDRAASNFIIENRRAGRAAPTPTALRRIRAVSRRARAAVRIPSRGRAARQGRTHIANEPGRQAAVRCSVLRPSCVGDSRGSADSAKSLGEYPGRVRRTASAVDPPRVTGTERAVPVRSVGSPRFARNQPIGGCTVRGSAYHSVAWTLMGSGRDLRSASSRSCSRTSWPRLACGSVRRLPERRLPGRPS